MSEKRPTFVLDYLMKNYPDGRLTGACVEYVMDSPFVLDRNAHMSVNVETGLWQDFKSGFSGNFARLMAWTEGITIAAAKSKILYREYAEGKEPKNYEIVEVVDKKLDTYYLEPITGESDIEDPLISKALTYLLQRKLFPTKDNEFYVCRSGRYANRLIIPFKEGKNIFYFQARALDEGQQPKYLNPSRSEGVIASNVVYPFNPDSMDTLYVTEGVMDALTIIRAGGKATCTNGCSVSDQQLHTIYDNISNIVVAYDNDEAGEAGLEKFDRARKRHMHKPFDVTYPGRFKDWNEALCAGADILNMLRTNTKPYDAFSILRKKLESISNLERHLK